MIFLLFSGGNVEEEEATYLIAVATPQICSIQYMPVSYCVELVLKVLYSFKLNNPQTAKYESNSVQFDHCRVKVLYIGIHLNM